MADNKKAADFSKRKQDQLDWWEHRYSDIIRSNDRCKKIREYIIDDMCPVDLAAAPKTLLSMTDKEALDFFRKDNVVLEINGILYAAHRQSLCCLLSYLREL